MTLSVAVGEEEPLYAWYSWACHYAKASIAEPPFFFFSFFFFYKCCRHQKKEIKDQHFLTRAIKTLTNYCMLKYTISSIYKTEMYCA